MIHGARCQQRKNNNTTGKSLLLRRQLSVIKSLRKTDHQHAIHSKLLL